MTPFRAPLETPTSRSDAIALGNAWSAGSVLGVSVGLPSGWLRMYATPDKSASHTPSAPSASGVSNSLTDGNLALSVAATWPEAIDADPTHAPRHLRLVREAEGEVNATSSLRRDPSASLRALKPEALYARTIGLVTGGRVTPQYEALQSALGVSQRVAMRLLSKMVADGVLIRVGRFYQVAL